PRWQIMINIDYQHSRGLGTKMLGNPFFVVHQIKTMKEELGCQPTPDDDKSPTWTNSMTTFKPPREPLSWSLYQHLQKGPSMPGHDKIASNVSIAQNTSRPRKWVKLGDTEHRWGYIDDLSWALGHLFLLEEPPPPDDLPPHPLVNI